MATMYKKYEPKCFSEIILPNGLKTALAQARTEKTIQPMLFYGEPGRGKTLTATLLRNGAFVLRRNDRLLSQAESIDNARRAATTASIDFIAEEQLDRLIIIEEIDRFDANGHGKIADLIDSAGHVASFVATTNHLHRVPAGLTSRLTPVEFAISKNDRILWYAWKDRLTEIYQMEYGCDPDPSSIEKALKSFPDGRAMIQSLAINSIQH